MTETVAIAVKTIDRRPRGSRNYLGETLRNLERGGVFESEHLHSLTLVDGGSEDLDEYIASETGKTPVEMDFFDYRGPRPTVEVPSGPASALICEVDHGDRTYHRNAQRAIELAGRAGADWAMVIEDDIDVCADFLESVVVWMREHAVDGPMLYSFGANYQNIGQIQKRGGSVWRYPCAGFYGAVCCAWRPEDALDIVDWYGDDPHFVEPNGSKSYDCHHDLALAKWGQDRGLSHFLASVPCLVQHIGLESGLGNRPIQYGGFGGRDYSYANPKFMTVGVGGAR